MICAFSCSEEHGARGERGLDSSFATPGAAFSDPSGASRDGISTGLDAGAPEGGARLGEYDASATDAAISCPDEGVNVFAGGPERTRLDCDMAYAAMKPVAYMPPPDRFATMPKTAAALCAQREIRMLMLGDSIVNDTTRSRWDEYLAEATGALITKISAIRGSTGAVWFSAGNRVYCNALRFDPDLVILGGISEPDITALRAVVEEIRAGSDAEILLMTPAFGEINPLDPKWSYAIDDTGTDYRSQVKRLAEELRTGFLDMTAHWGEYIVQSGQPLSDFKRDDIHASRYGEQVLGRILMQHLKPDGTGVGACAH